MVDDEEPIQFERPIQAIAGIMERFNMPRDTIKKALARGEFADCAYQSGTTWLIDTDCQQFQHWLLAYLDRRRRRRRKLRR
jgi:hypothetical protein